MKKKNENLNFFRWVFSGNKRKWKYCRSMKMWWDNVVSLTWWWCLDQIWEEVSSTGTGRDNRLYIYIYINICLFLNKLIIKWHGNEVGPNIWFLKESKKNNNNLSFYFFFNYLLDLLRGPVVWCKFSLEGMELRNWFHIKVRFNSTMTRVVDYRFFAFWIIYFIYLKS
jgi:hypothetical protein